MPSFSGAKSGYKPRKPKSVTGGTKPQSEMTYEELVARGPGYGSQGARAEQGLTASDNPFKGSGTLGGYFNNSFAGQGAQQRSAEQLLADALSGIRSGQNNGGGSGTITQTGGGGGGGGNAIVGGNNNAGAAATGQVAGAQTYQERFGGGDASIDQYGYTPTGLVQMNQSGNYDVLIADMLAEAGITDPQMIKDLTQQAKYGSLIDMIAGGDPNADASVGFIADYINQMMTPGGQVPTFDELVNLLIGEDANKYATGIQAGVDENSINNYIMDLLDSVGGNQYYQKAMYGQLDQDQRLYNANKYKGGAGGSYSEQLRDNGFFG